MIIAIVFSIWVLALITVALILYALGKSNDRDDLELGFRIIIITLALIGAVPSAVLFSSSICLFYMSGESAMYGSLTIAIIYLVIMCLFLHICCSFFEETDKYEVRDEIFLFAIMAIFTGLLVYPAKEYLVENAWDILLEYSKIF